VNFERVKDLPVYFLSSKTGQVKISRTFLSIESEDVRLILRVEKDQLAGTKTG
jgi:hypothetical protein